MGKKYYTPVGELEWPWILTPDVKHNSEGEYHVDAYFDSDDIKPVIDAIHAAVDKMVAASEKQNPSIHFPYKKMEDGSYKLKFKQKRFIMSGPYKGKENKIKVVDNRLQPWDKDKWIGNGSTGVICFTIYPYDVKSVGCVLKLAGVQVIDYVPYESNDTGFEETEGNAADANEATVDFSSAMD